MRDQTGGPVSDHGTAAPGGSGMIFNVQRFSLDDGPGIRTTVFLKGCPLHCAWCHNPESQSCHPETMVPVHGPSEVTGRRWTVDEVIALVERDRSYYETSGGGMTVSGGEPLAQPKFALELLHAARQRGLHSTVDTSGFAPPQVFQDALAAASLILFDFKETDPVRHRQWTGVPLDPILQNLRLAAVGAAELWLRLPVVPLLNDRDDHWRRAGEILTALPGSFPVYLLPYHALGEGKLRSLGREEPLLRGVHEPPAERLREIASLLAAHGLRVHLPGDEVVSPE